jgi:acid phosphatase
MQRRWMAIVGASGVIGALALSAAVPADAKDDHGRSGSIKHIVVLYQENHSLDNLYGTWGAVNGDAVEGVAQATLGHTVQVGQSGVPYTCLKQNDVNLTAPPLSNQCIDPDPAVGPSNHFTNLPFNIDAVIPSTARTCPPPNVFAPNGVLAPTGLPGGCTRDLVHRFYQEQFQIDGGRQDRYVQGSDAVGLVMGYYDSTQLPIYRYLHSQGAPNYVVADHFFQGAFGGSFLNHQVLVSAQAPIYAGADNHGTTTGCATGTANCDLHSVVDVNGFPNSSYPLYKPVGTPAVPTPAVVDGALTEAADADGHCHPSYPAGAVAAPAGTLCGDFAVNTIQPFTQPYAPGTVVGRRLPLLHSDNIGDAMSASHVSWAWYSGGWDNAAGNNGRDARHPLGPGWTNGPTNIATGMCAAPAGEFVANNAVFPNCPDALFQYHHQPLSYFANYADGTRGRLDHLKDEEQFVLDAEHGTLPAVSFVKPLGEENEHPGYASEPHGSQHLVDLIKKVLDGPDGKDTLIIVTYDEFGGQWDHVSPPGTDGNRNPHDVFGPGTRVPALLVSSDIRHSGVDHSSHDTTSILTTIEHQFRVRSLRDPSGRPTRDAKVDDLLSAVRH